MKPTRDWPVWVYVPNIIGYLRIILSIIAFTNYRTPGVFFGYYFVGFVLDAADGLAARKLNQSSDFGAQLDMLTDRCATAALLTVLSYLYPNQAYICYALIFLDGYSHWVQMVAGICAGTASHKSAGRGWLLQLYYWRPCLTFVCSLNEMCFLILYLQAFTEGPPFLPGLSLYSAILWCAVPVCIIKQIISVRQIFSAHATITDAMVSKLCTGT
ncbi:CDP-diacylglycerol--inositol 3-phosphatidyltransferase [Gracilariopsis chorda]|uniref:CDP-diacylglycerol--inositol 3-phosphatidyltransferase n=1 Tax=Gracilariopsis chorda TaxID=448386 RepID=A0A2V3J427_9FLOR|nr:CDP-diacylglycerol--inositol 3-phosphatidyltransferase [Gracilariopsis chorda]|eukprot:PXF49168.1 CDP-diacylglycerol--inositol 3-phosphatidyltransferase [Gracilariopsis chorda]